MTLDESSRLPEGGVQVVPRDVISEVFGGEAVVVQLATGAYYSLDALRTSQFESLCGGSTIRSLVPRGADATSVLSFVRFLVDEQLVSWAGDVELLGPGSPTAPDGIAKFTDLADLIVLDPIHDIDLDGDGWPTSTATSDADGLGG